MLKFLNGNLAIRSNDNKRIFSRLIVFFSIAVLSADNIYKIVNGINYGTKTKCILYKTLPKWLFLSYEYLVELLLIVIIGVFVGALLEKYFNKIKRFFPKNQLLAFIYASIIPVCACGVVPLIDAMKNKAKLRTIITFVISAPLLNPFIIAISFSVLGVRYGILRIVSAFVLAIFTGTIVQFIAGKIDERHYGEYQICKSNCFSNTSDPFLKTINTIKKLIPYIFLAGILGLLFEYFNPKQLIETANIQHNTLMTLIVMVIGIPIYLCNGADVIFLKPLLFYTDFSIGSAMAFSLTSSAICISSIIMLIKFLGKKLTFITITTVFILTFLIAVVLNV